MPVNEAPLADEKPEDYVQRLASWKACEVPAGDEETVLGADTTVVIDDLMLGKPENAGDARRMLELLSGRRHQVMTGICVKRGENKIVDWAATQVWFRSMTEAEIEEYVASGEPMDKAGAYAIQGLASKYIEKIEGCYFNVVGLPISLVYKHLREMA